MNFLLSYVSDLTDQNQVLVQTINDLQEEADQATSSALQVRFEKLFYRTLVCYCVAFTLELFVSFALKKKVLLRFDAHKISLKPFSLLFCNNNHDPVCVSQSFWTVRNETSTPTDYGR